MVRPFGLRDIALIWKFQRKETRLDLPEALIASRSSLRLALLSYLLHRDGGAYTCVLCGCDTAADEHSGRQGLRGFAQVCPRRGRAEWDIVCLAPSLDSHGASPAAWRDLIEHLCQEAGEQGVLRLFTKVADEEQAQEIFKELDFNVYAHEDILYCPSGASFQGLEAPEIGLRGRRPEDDWGLQQLYVQSTPSNAQTAEGFASPGSAHPFTMKPSTGDYISSQRKDEEYVWEVTAAPHGPQIRGYLELTKGHAGYGLRLVVHPDHRQAEADLISWGLAALGKRPARPIYCSVRQYEGSIRRLLQDHGFAQYAAQALMVKHLVLRVKEPVLKLAPALEKRVKTAPTHT